MYQDYLRNQSISIYEAFANLQYMHTPQNCPFNPRCPHLNIPENEKLECKIQCKYNNNGESQNSVDQYKVLDYGMPHVYKPAAKNNQPLTQEEIDKMSNNYNGFNLDPVEKNKIVLRCTHKYKDGSFAIKALSGEGDVECSICGKRFNTIIDDDDVNARIKEVLDIIQTAKLVGLNIPTEIVDEYVMPLTQLLEKLPKLWNICVKDFNKYNHNSSYGFYV